MAKALTIEFLDALRRGDRAGAAALWDGYPFGEAHKSFEFDRFMTEFDWLTIDDDVEVIAVPSFAWTDPSPVATVFSLGPALSAAPFVLSPPGEPLPIQRLPSSGAVVDPPPGSPVAPGDVITFHVLPVEGGARAFLYGSELEVTVDHDDVIVWMVLPDNLPQTVVITLTLASPEVPDAYAVAYPARR